MKKIPFLFLILLLCANGFGQNSGTLGSFSLFHTDQARTFSSGRFNVYVNSNFFAKKGVLLGSAPAASDTSDFRVMAASVSLTYGIINHLDFSLSMRFFQDTQYSNSYNLPDDIFVTLKTGSYFFGQDRFAFALMASARFGTGEIHNYPFVEYASGSTEYGFRAALSFYADPYFPGRSVNVHYNVGWWNHNEKGQKINVIGGEDREAKISSSYLSMALATAVPLGDLEVRGELSGILVLAEPDKFVYSAEGYAFFTPSIRYHLQDWVDLDLGVDLRISPADRQYTSGVYDLSERVDLPKNYPAWRIQFGANFNILPVGRESGYRSEGTDRNIRRMLEFYDQIDAEREKAKHIEKDLLEIRAVRENAENEIAELKRLIE